MEAEIIFRVVTKKGVEFVLGSPWLDKDGNVALVDGSPLTAKIGAMFLIPESTVEFSPDENDAVPVAETVPAHYEIWALPDEGSQMKEANETRLLRIWVGEVAFDESLWPADAANNIVAERFSRVEAPSPPQQQPLAGAPNGG